MVALAAVSRPEYKDSNKIFDRARNEIDADLLAMLDRADPSGAFRAVAIVENLNRPPWVRRLERLFIRRNGTYGLMQMKSERPISDLESVDAFIAAYAGHLPLESNKGRRAIFRQHNRSKAFRYLVLEVFRSGV